MPRYDSARLASRRLTLAAAVLSLLVGALPLPAQATLSTHYAALFDNSAGAAAKMVTADDVRAYVNARLSTAQKKLIVSLLGAHCSSPIRVRLGAGTAVTTAGTLTAVLALPAVQVEGPMAAVPWAALPGGNDRRDAFVSILKAINLLEQDAPIVEPQPQRARDGTFQNFSVPFLQKHAARNDSDAIEIARKRFNSQAPFTGEPAPPISQNLDRETAFKELKTFVATLAGGNFFGHVETHLQNERNTFIGQLSAVETVQYITPGEYRVRTYNPVPGAPVTASRAGEAAQRVQIAMTWSSQTPSTLIVNHLVTPVGAAAPAPGAMVWHELAYGDISGMPGAFNNADKRPRIFYALEPLSARNDL